MIRSLQDPISSSSCSCDCSCNGCFSFTGFSGQYALDYDLTSYDFPDSGDTINLYNSFGVFTKQIVVKDIRIDKLIGSLYKEPVTGTKCFDHIGVISYTNVAGTRHSHSWITIGGSGSPTTFNIRIELVNSDGYLNAYNPTTTGVSEIASLEDELLTANSLTLSVRKSCTGNPPYQFEYCENTFLPANWNGYKIPSDLLFQPNLSLIFTGRYTRASTFPAVNEEFWHYGLTQESACGTLYDFGSYATSSDVATWTVEAERYPLSDPDDRTPYILETKSNGVTMLINYANKDFSIHTLTANSSTFNGCIWVDGFTLFGSTELYSMKDYLDKKSVVLTSEFQDPSWTDEQIIDNSIQNIQSSLTGSVVVTPVCSC